MALTFAYRIHPGAAPVWPLAGRMGRPRPVVTLAVVGPTATWTGTALLDTGSDDTVFPEDVAKLVGIDLTGAPAAAASGVGMATSPIRYAAVRLRLTDGQEFREWPARAGFTPVPLKRGLLGFAGFFQFFTATFDGDRELVELAINALYPGT